jgi:hypothetical protein
MPGWVQQIADISGIHSWSCSDDVTILVMGYSGSNGQIRSSLPRNIPVAQLSTCSDFGALNWSSSETLSTGRILIFIEIAFFSI